MIIVGGISFPTAHTATRAGTMTNPVPTGTDEGAYDIMVAMLREWGLESLAPAVRSMLEDGRTPEQIQVLLQDTDEYKQRFAGNERRREKGLPVLSPRDYLATEAAYRQIMESSGMPAGFYDSPEDFAEWIGNDVAPTEIRDRVDSALDVAWRMDEETAKTFKDFYGITESNLAAFFLDRDRGLQELERISRAGVIGGAAQAQGLSVSRGRAEQLAGSHIGPEQIRAAFGQVAGMTRDVGRLARIHGGTFGQRQAEQAVFFSDEQAQRRRRRLIAAEQAVFRKGSGVSPDALAQDPAGMGG